MTVTNQKIDVKFLTIKENRLFTNFFMFIYLFFGLDFGFTSIKSIKINILLKLFTITKSLIITAALIIIVSDCVNTIKLIWYSLNLLQYLCVVIILVFPRAKKTFRNFQNDLFDVDSQMGIDSRTYNLELKIVICIIICFFERTIVFFTISIAVIGSCFFPGIMYFLYICIFLSNDVMMIMYMFVFYSVSCRIKKLSQIIQNDKDIVSCEYIYKKMAESTEEVMKTFGAAFTATLFCTAPAMMLTIVISLKNTYGHDFDTKLANYNGAVISTTVALLFTFIPIFFAGKLVLNVGELKIVLHDRLLQDRGRNSYEDIKRFISYVEARPFRFRVCHLVPIDWSLPVIIMNLCITYMIVTLQFLHV